MSRTFAYARIRDAATDPEEIMNLFAGHRISSKRLFIDGAETEEEGSAKRDPYEAFDEMAAGLDVGDLVLIDSIESLGDNNMEILTRWETLRLKRHAHIRVLDTAYLDTTLRGRDMPDEYIADLAMTVYAAATRHANDVRKKRQADGIASAKKKGVRFGIKRKEIPADFEKYKQMYLNGEIKGRDAADILGMSHSTFFYRVKH